MERRYSPTKVCNLCGHHPCPCCGTWCDMLLESSDMCCEGRCSYDDDVTPQFFTSSGEPWPMAELFEDQRARAGMDELVAEARRPKAN